MVAAGVAGAALVVGGPTAVWIVSAHEYGDDGHDERARGHHRKVEDGRPYLHYRGPQLPPGQPPGQLRKELKDRMKDRMDDLKANAEWTRCVLELARTATGPVDLEKECGPRPEPLDPPGMGR